jgi:predicted Zn-dependent protease
MKTLQQQLEPFLGYLDLQMFDEAMAELDALPSEFQEHELVGLGRLDVLLGLKKWDETVELGQTLCARLPQVETFFIHTAFAYHELRKTREAKQTLLSGPSSLQRQAVYFYNLSCYQAQLGELPEARKSLGRCFILDPEFRNDATDDPDLKPLRASPLWIGL